MVEQSIVEKVLVPDGQARTGTRYPTTFLEGTRVSGLKPRTVVAGEVVIMSRQHRLKLARMKTSFTKQQHIKKMWVGRLFPLQRRL
jgi:hypothetical protein